MFSPVAGNRTTREAGTLITGDERQRELFEFMALLHSPPREIIDLDERNGYESFLAAQRQVRA